MQSDVKERLRRAVPVMALHNPYMNVADKVYLSFSDRDDLLKRIEELEAQVSAYEKYLDRGTRTSRSGVPLTATPPQT